MVLHNPGNWHWVDKDARDWAKQYFDKKLVGVTAEENGVSVRVEKVLSIDGDCDVNQRKGKVVTLYDLKVKLEYKGTNAEGVEASGSITIPEVAYDTEEDEYQFEISNYSDSAEKQAIRELVRTKITPQLRSVFGKFSGDLISEHAKDIQHKPENDPRNKSGSSTPVPTPKGGATGKDATKPVEVKHTKSHVVNTTTVKMAFEFRASASDLYQIFVDPKKTELFTREKPNPFEPQEGGKFRLFNGNVEGTFKKLEESKKIVQDWRLASWPQGHYSTLNLTFDEGSGFTTLRLHWDGVPLGQEEVAKQNFGEYYAKSIGNTFGYASPISKSGPLKSKKRARTHTNTTAVQGGWWDMVQVAGPPVLSVGIVWLAIAAAVVYFRRPE